MRILALDTAGPSVSVALMDQGNLVYECTLKNGLTHSQSLMPLLEQGLQALGWSVEDLELIAAVVGPGSFTGVRIGVTTARSLAQARNIPCIGVDALEAMAAGIFGDGLVCALQDARAEQVYGAVFQAGWLPQRLTEDCACSLDEMLAQARAFGQEMHFLGDGALRHAESISERWGAGARIIPPQGQILRAASAAALAWARQDQAHGYRDLNPLYLRAPQAERERLAREANHAQR